MGTQSLIVSTGQMKHQHTDAFGIEIVIMIFHLTGLLVEIICELISLNQL